MKSTDEHNENRAPAIEDIAASDIDNRICWNDYNISGDIEEIKKILRVIGRMNIGIGDIIYTLSTTNANYVTTGKGTGPNRLLIALKEAIDKLPVKLEDIDRPIVNVWTGKGNSRPVKITEIVAAMHTQLLDIIPQLDLFWGVADDPALNDDVKVTLIAVNRHKLC